MADKTTELTPPRETPVTQPEPHRPMMPAMTTWEEMEAQMDRLFETLMPRGWLRPFHWEPPFMPELPHMEARLPKMDVIERDEEIAIRAEIPGVAKEDLEVSVTDDRITIKGHSRHETEEEKGSYHRRETRRGFFSRTLPLPASVDGDKAHATFKDGILELTLPKMEKAKRVTLKLE